MTAQDAFREAARWHREQQARFKAKRTYWVEAEEHRRGQEDAHEESAEHFEALAAQAEG